MDTPRAKKRKTSLREMLPNLPLDVIDNIFTLVPTKPVVRFMSLNKHFLTLLTSQVFAEKHLSRSPRDQNKCSVILQAVDPNEFYYIPDGKFRKGIKLNTSYIGDNAHIVGCSNGIVCLSHQDEQFGITLWNPATKESRKLPHPLMKKRPHSFVALGFSFHPTINDYKVVKLMTVRNWMGPYRLEVEVYSLRTNSWREMGEFPYRLLVSDKLSRAVVNGIVHWFGRHKNDVFKYNLILAFDMVNEVFRELPVPKVIYRGYSWDSYLRTYQGYLSIITVEPHYINVWAMNDYGVEESWTKVCRLEYVPFIERPLDFIKDDEILIKRSPWYELLSYNSNTGETKNAGIPEVEYYKDVDAIPYLESLVQLKAHTQAVEDWQENDVEEYLEEDDA